MAKLKRSPEEQYRYMTETPVSTLILTFAVPSMLTTLITSIYNLADTFFVGQIGTSAAASVGVVFSINMILMALGFWVGTGGSTLISNLLGSKETETAQRICSTAFWLSFASGAAIGIVTILGGEGLMKFLGATDTIAPYAAQYGSLLALGFPFQSSSLMLGQCLRSEGMSQESMYGNVIGGILNMILDPLFIFVLNMGIRGAAIATALSQLVGWWILIQYYIFGKTQLNLSIRHVTRKPSEYRLLLAIGFPSLARHGCNMISNVVLNSVAGNWGDASIAAMSICNRLCFLSNAVFQGLNNGSQPVMGYAYGSKNYSRVRAGYWYTIKMSLISMVGFAVVGLFFAPQLVQFFRDDPEVVLYGTTALRMICLALPFGCLFITATNVFQMLKKPAISTGISVGRQLMLYVPLLLILPRMLGVYGMQLSAPAADIIMGSVGLWLIKRQMDRLKEEEMKMTKR